MEGVKSKTKEVKHLRLKLPHEQSTTQERWELTAFCLFSDKSKKFLQFFSFKFSPFWIQIKGSCETKIPFLMFLYPNLLCSASIWLGLIGIGETRDKEKSHKHKK